MVDFAQSTVQPVTSARPHKVLRMVTSDRTAGSIPSWDYPKNGEEKIAAGLDHSALSASGTAATQKALSYRAPQAESADNDHAFGFADLVDMVNPLQHIPLVNLAYRKITGDTIKPIGEIVGGAIFGGPIGAAGGLVNTIIEGKTGENVAQNAISLIKPDERRETASPSSSTALSKERKAYDDLPASLLAFAETPLPKVDITRTPKNETQKADHAPKPSEKYHVFADRRTAGTIRVYS